MKLLIDYSDSELANISDEERNSVYLLELAERGIPLPSALPVFTKKPEDREDLKPDQTVYVVSGCYFTTMEIAEQVAALINANQLHTDYDWRSSGPNLKYVSNDRDITTNITQEVIYSAEKWAQFGEEVKGYTQREAYIQKRNKERENIIKEQSKVLDDIYERISTAVQNTTRLAELHSIFEQYKTMANGDQDIAVRFLLNAHYSEVVEYNDEQLAAIGLNREAINAYNVAAKKDEE